MNTMHMNTFLLTPLCHWPPLKAKQAALLAQLVGGGERIVDVLFHLPISIFDRSALIFKGRVVGHIRPRSRQAPHQTHLQLYNGHCLQITFFHRKSVILESLLPLGQMRVVSGKRAGHGIVNPDYITTLEQSETIPLFEPIYPLVKGLTTARFHAIIKLIFEHWPHDALEEWWPPAFLAHKKWPSFRQALHAMHFPTCLEALTPDSLAHLRLCADEWLAHTRISSLARQGEAKPLLGQGHLWQERMDRATFCPTKGQTSAIEALAQDMAQTKPMLRLLQGDVGSGKTLVAEWALMRAVESGFQGAFMAPTDVLVNQHVQTLKQNYPSVRVAKLAQSLTRKEKESVLNDLQNGTIHIVVGTHAIFQRDVFFHNLGLCVIDEQHRFGVLQRRALQSKSGSLLPHTLLMSATPIPRTLSLALYGHIDISILDEKPGERPPIKTTLLPMHQLVQVAQRLKARLEQTGQQAYWVCPLIEESDALPLSALTEREKTLRPLFGPTLAVLHGKMHATQKEDILTRFATGEKSLLLSTSVIEVGVHVPSACVMIIENAQQFGLAQLHQLRGRVGRSGQQSFCILLYSEPLGGNAKERLKTIRNHTDGFFLARKDLLLRGCGEKFGTKQVGHNPFIFIHLSHDTHQELIQELSLLQHQVSNLEHTHLVEAIFTQARLTGCIFS